MAIINRRCCANFINKLLEDPLFDLRSSTAPLGLTPEPALLLLAQYTVPADDRILHKLQLCNLPWSAVCRLPPLWGLPRSQPYFCWLSIQSRQTVDPYHKEEMPKKKMYPRSRRCCFIRCLANTPPPIGAYPGPSPTFAGSEYSAATHRMPIHRSVLCWFHPPVALEDITRRRCLIRSSVVYRPIRAYPGASPTFAGSVYSPGRWSNSFTSCIHATCPYKEKTSLICLTCCRRRCCLDRLSFGQPPLWGLPRIQPYFCWLSIQYRMTVNPYHQVVAVSLPIYTC